MKETFRRLEGLSDKFVGKQFCHLNREVRVENSGFQKKDMVFSDEIPQPKTIICELKQEAILRKENQESCSSEKEHKVNALAPMAEEGRDNLR